MSYSAPLSYPARTLLRYFSKESQTHDTALVVEGGSILHVKKASQPVKIHYDNVEAWLASLPDTPSVDQLEVVTPEDVTSRVEDKKKKEKEEKEEKKKAKEKTKKKEAEEEKKGKKKLHLVPMSQEIPSTYWTHHLHRMMKEANPTLLQRADVVDAFNGLVEVLLKHQSHILSRAPHHRMKYNADSPLHSMCMVKMNCVSRNEETGRVRIAFPYHLPGGFDYKRTTPHTAEENVIQQEIMTAYHALFVLIRADVLPYMNQKEKEAKRKEKKKMIENIVKKLQKSQEMHEQEVERRKASIVALEKRHEKSMDMARNLIASLTREMEEES